jgi:hypothetical protein
LPLRVVYRARASGNGTGAAARQIVSALFGTFLMHVI